MKIHTLALATIVTLAMTWTTQAKPDKPRKARPEHPVLSDMDTNGDGSVSLDEFLAAHTARLQKRFSQMDQNADGLVTKDEMQNARKQLRGKKDRKNKRSGPDEAQAGQASDPAPESDDDSSDSSDDHSSAPSEDSTSSKDSEEDGD